MILIQADRVLLDELVGVFVETFDRLLEWR